jgi:hypothetical protein
MEWLPFPGDGSSASMILSIDRGQDRRLYALELDPKPEAFEPPLVFDDDAQLVALLFSERLSALGLEPGPLEPAPPPNQSLAELPIEASYVASLQQGRAPAWTVLNEIEESLLDFLVPRLDTRCLEFEQEILIKAPGTMHHFMIPLPGGEVLAGYDSTIVHVADGMIVETATLAELTSATRTSTAIFVLGDALYRLSLDPIRLEHRAEAPRGSDRPDWMSAGTYDEIFGLSRNGIFVRFDGARWTSLGSLVIEGNDLSKGGALWLGPGEGAVANPSSNTIARWDGTLHHDFVEMDSFGFGAAVLSPRFGPVVIDVRWGLFYQYEEEGSWIALPFMGDTPQVQALTDFREGLAWGTATGLVGYATERTSCASMPAMDASEVYELAPLGDGLLAGYTDLNTDYVLVYFRPTEK